MFLPAFLGLQMTKRILSPTTEHFAGSEIGLSSKYSPPATIKVSLSGVIEASWAPLLIVLTGFVADLPSKVSSPICSET